MQAYKPEKGNLYNVIKKIIKKSGLEDIIKVDIKHNTEYDLIGDYIN